MRIKSTLSPLAFITPVCALFGQHHTIFELENGYQIEMNPDAVAAAYQVKNGSITIDGDLSDWPDTPLGGFPNPTYGETGIGPIEVPLPDAVDCSASWRATWDKDYLYLAVEVADDSVTEETEALRYSDGIVLYLDADLSHVISDSFYSPGMDFVNDWHREMSWRGNSEPGFYDASAGDSGLDLDIESASRTTESGYILELRILITSLNTNTLKPKIGAYIGFDIQVKDNDDGGDAITDRIGWASNYSDQPYNPYRWGVLEFKGPYSPSPWADLEAIDGFKNTATEDTPGFGWLYDAYYPWIYSYGIGDVEGEWVLCMRWDGATRFWGYSATGGYIFWATADWGYYYSLSTYKWIQINGVSF